VRINDREVRTYELIDRYPRRGLSCKYQTIVFWDEGCTEIKNSTDFAFEADRFQEYRVQDERIAHVIQEREDQLRSRRADQVRRAATSLDDLHLTSALVAISKEWSTEDAFSAPQFEAYMCVLLEEQQQERAALMIQEAWRLHFYGGYDQIMSDLAAIGKKWKQNKAARVIQQGWKQYRHRLQLPACLEARQTRKEAKAARVIQQCWQQYLRRRVLELLLGVCPRTLVNACVSECI
jgi:hypothetical protein